jgi:hypothetical protein
MSVAPALSEKLPSQKLYGKTPQATAFPVILTNVVKESKENKIELTCSDVLYTLAFVVFVVYIVYGFYWLRNENKLFEQAVRLSEERTSLLRGYINQISSSKHSQLVELYELYGEDWP